jgi:electron transfer flavoprotein alpha subunit
MKTFVVSETSNSARELIAAAQAQGSEEIIAVTFGQEMAMDIAKRGATLVIAANLSTEACKEDVADMIIEYAKGAREALVLTSSTRRMVNAAAQIAQGLGTAPLVDVKQLSGGVAKHASFGGKIILGEKAQGPYTVAVMQSGAFEPISEELPACPIEQREVSARGGLRVIERGKKEAETVDLTAARAIVCVGRGVNSVEGFELCVELKDALGAELGCTRPVTETENPLMPRERYIGASGVVCKPELYVGVAASGQTQHTMGMYESGVVVVIDKNPEAPFFEQSDYGMVGDYREILPALTQALEAR